MAGFDPRLSMSLKAARKVYCYGFDPALLTTYTTSHDIEEQLRYSPRLDVGLMAKWTFFLIC